MDDIVLITNEQLTKYSPLGGNIDVDKYSFIIKETQVFVIEKILGTKLYDKIVLEYENGTISGIYDTLLKNYIQPILIYTVSAEYIIIGSFNVANSGIFKYTPENTQTPSQKEIEFLANQQRSKADVYIERMQRFLCDGANDIPEYDAPQDNNYDIDPDRDLSTFGGWRLSYGYSGGSNAEREIWKDILRDEGR